MSRQNGSDWHGARVSRKYKDNYDSIFKKEKGEKKKELVPRKYKDNYDSIFKKEEEEKKKELVPRIEGTNQRYRLVPRDEEI